MTVKQGFPYSDVDSPFENLMCKTWEYLVDNIGNVCHFNIFDRRVAAKHDLLFQMYL